MNANLGSTDKAIRIVLAIIIAGLFFSNVITGTLAIILMIIAGTLLLTSLISFCPLYTLLKISTKKKTA